MSETATTLISLAAFLAVVPLAWFLLLRVGRTVDLAIATVALIREYWSTDARIRRAMVAAGTDPDADI